MGHRCSLALAVLCSVLFCATNSPAATFVIDATGDAGDNNPGDGVCDSVLAGIDCTLRAAVQEANALVGRDRIEIPTLTISLDLAGDDDLAAVGDLDVTDALDIAGVGFSPTVSQISGEVIFNFLGADGSLTNLILQGGSTAIQSNNSVRLEITDLEIRTAGVMTIPGLMPTQECRHLLLKEGIDISSHRSHQLTPDLIKQAELVLGMTSFHVQMALRISEHAKGKTFLFKVG